MVEFHLLRPGWLIALLPLAIAVLGWRRRPLSSGGWRAFVDPHLLAAQFEPVRSGLHRRVAAAAPLALAWAIVCGAGPCWERGETPAARQQLGRVFVLDISQSMNAADPRPSRLVQARLALIDLLAASRDRQVGLVVFAAAPYAVVPLTDDAETVRALVGALQSDLAPVQGSDVGAALDYAAALLAGSGLPAGELLLLSDAQPTAADRAAAERLRAAGTPLSVLAIGSGEGAPVPGADGRALRDGAGRPVLAAVDRAALRALATAGGGRFAALAPGADAAALLPPVLAAGSESAAPARRAVEHWVDRGPDGMWLLLPWVLWAALRRWP